MSVHWRWPSKRRRPNDGRRTPAAAAPVLAAVEPEVSYRHSLQRYPRIQINDRREEKAEHRGRWEAIAAARSTWSRDDR